jgi:hypothetical protein
MCVFGGIWLFRCMNSDYVVVYILCINSNLQQQIGYKSHGQHHTTSVCVRSRWKTAQYFNSTNTRHACVHTVWLQCQSNQTTRTPATECFFWSMQKQCGYRVWRKHVWRISTRTGIHIRRVQGVWQNASFNVRGLGSFSVLAMYSQAIKRRKNLRFLIHVCYNVDAFSHSMNSFFYVSDVLIYI